MGQPIKETVFINNANGYLYSATVSRDEDYRPSCTIQGCYIEKTNIYHRPPNYEKFYFHDNKNHQSLHSELEKEIVPTIWTTLDIWDKTDGPSAYKNRVIFVREIQI